MNKPFTMVVKETKNKIVNICNESGLSFAILDLILQGISLEIHSLAERQTAEDEAAYARMVANATKKAEVTDDNVD